MVIISIGTSTKGTKWAETTLEEHIERIRNGAYAARVAEVRECTDPDLKKTLKEALPVSVYGGVVRNGETAGASSLQHLTGLALYDSDEHPLEPDVLDAEPAVQAHYMSSSGLAHKRHAVVALAPVPRDAAEFKVACTQMAEHLDAKWGVQHDEACHDAPHRAFVSHDSDASYTPSERGIVWLPAGFAPIAAALRFLVEKRAEFEREWYHEWFMVGCVLKNELGPDSDWLRYFNAWSAQMPGYTGPVEASKFERDESGASARVTCGSLFKLAQEYGFEVPQTEVRVNETGASNYRFNIRNGQIEAYRSVAEWAKRKVDSLDGWAVWHKRFKSEDYAKYRRQPGKPINKETWELLLEAAASENTVDPVEEWLRTLPEWDGECRIDTVLNELLGAPDTELNREFSRRWFIGMVDRALNPGCPMPWFLVLLGSQGIGKSLFLRGLVPDAVRGEWCADDVPLDAETKVQIEQRGTAWVIEYAEGVGLGRGANNRIKRMVTSTEDRSRMAYHQTVTTQKRCWVGCITLNEPSLPDDPENRRYAVVECTRTMSGGELLTWFDENRDQLYAEALECLRDGETALIGDEFRAEQEAMAKRAVYQNEVVQLGVATCTKNFAGKGLFKITRLMDEAGIDRRFSDAAFKAALRAEGWVFHERKRMPDGTQGPCWEAPEPKPTEVPAAFDAVDTGERLESYVDTSFVPTVN